VCGICGYIDKVMITDEQLTEMNQTMYHRGPDDFGIWQFKGEDVYIGLAHRRLSIMDLSEMGHQPMFSQDGNLVIVFNGEIYNFKELRFKLMKLGYCFVSECDTEVILAAYQQWGEEAIKRIDGMFAFALVDRKEEKVVFARDRIGKKPLYYFWNGHTFIFASELKAIMKHPQFKKELNEGIIERYLCYQYINEPDTIFKETYKLPAAHYMVMSKGNLKIKKYWDIYEQYQKGKENEILDYNECKQTLKSCILQSVKKRLVADVPVGAFLSGGVDSTLITAIANDVVKGGIKTFTIGFEDKERDEAIFAAKIASYLGTDHSELYVREKDMLDMLEDMCLYYDEPFADPSEIPTMLVSKLAKKQVTVALTGDGGDEFFCGYSMYDFVAKAQKLDNLAGIGNIFFCNKIGTLIKKRLPIEAAALLDNRDDDYKVQLFVDLPQKAVSRMLLQPNPNVKYDLESMFKLDNWQERRMLLDMYTYLPEDILTKADRASMKYSLELRCPLLDKDVMEKTFRVPHYYKYKNGSKKYILKEILYDYIPKEMMDRPKKGFGVPLGKWIRTYLKKEIAAVSERNFIEKQGIFNYEVVWKLIEKVNKSDQKPYPKVLWAYFVFQIWYKLYMV